MRYAGCCPPFCDLGQTAPIDAVCPLAWDASLRNLSPDVQCNPPPTAMLSAELPVVPLEEESSLENDESGLDETSEDKGPGGQLPKVNMDEEEEQNDAE